MENPAGIKEKTLGRNAPVMLDRNRRPAADHEDWRTEALPRLREILGVDPDGPPDRFAESLPFAAPDTTMGSETELQAVVIGERQHVDLALAIEGSNYYQNLLKRTGTGEASRRPILDLERFLDNHPFPLP